MAWSSHVSSSRTENVAIFSVLHTTHHRHCQISKCRDPLRRFTKTVDLRFATCQSLADCVDCEHQKLPPPCITMLFVCLFVWSQTNMDSHNIAILYFVIQSNESLRMQEHLARTIDEILSLQNCVEVFSNVAREFRKICLKGLSRMIQDSLKFPTNCSKQSLKQIFLCIVVSLRF